MSLLTSYKGFIGGFGPNKHFTDCMSDGGFEKPDFFSLLFKSQTRIYSWNDLEKHKSTHFKHGNEKY